MSYPHGTLLTRSQQAASRHHPGLFSGLVSILNAATADKHRGLVATLPELSELLHNAGLHKLAGQCIEYAQFVSDVTADGCLGQAEPEDEEGDGHEDDDSYDGDHEDEAVVARFRQAPMPCTRQNAEAETDSTNADFEHIPHPALDSGEETECEVHTVTQRGPDKLEPRKRTSMNSNSSKKRKKPPSGVLPQRRSVRQWNRVPDGGEPSSTASPEWALIGQARGAIDFD